MAKQLLFGESGGGGLSGGTVLWENPNPTANWDNQAITLQDYTSFDYVGIEFANDTTLSIVCTAIYAEDEFAHAVETDGDGLMIGRHYSGNGYGRVVFRSGDNVMIGRCHRLNRESTSNNRVIPLRIIGY